MDYSFGEGFANGRQDWRPSVPENQIATTHQSAPSDLINFLKAIPDGRFPLSVRYPKWFLLLIAELRIYCLAEGLRLQRLPQFTREQVALAT